MDALKRYIQEPIFHQSNFVESVDKDFSSWSKMLCFIIVRALFNFYIYIWSILRE